jgi:hypothetical protein
MNFPLPLKKIVGSITDDLPEDEMGVFIDAIKQSVGSGEKDLSLVYWALLGSELRFLPKRIPDDVQALIDQLIAGVDRIAAGKEWHEATATLAEVDAVYNTNYVFIAPHVLNTLYALKSAADAIRGVDEDAEVIRAAVGAVRLIADAVWAETYNQSYSVETHKNAEVNEDFDELAARKARKKAAIAYTVARRRQGDTLLALIDSAQLMNKPGGGVGMMVWRYLTEESFSVIDTAFIIIILREGLNHRFESMAIALTMWVIFEVIRNKYAP